MALIGNIEQFKGNAEEFETYVERVEHLFKVNNVSQEMKVSMFITLAGSEVYQTLRNLAAPRIPTELTADEYNGYEEVNSDLLNLNTVRGNETAPYRILLKLEQKRVAFEVDTGACKSVMSFRRFKEILNVPLKPVTYKSNVVSGQDIKAVGECLVEVQYGGQNYQPFLTIIESNKDFVPLLGRNWLNILCPNWQSSFGTENQSVNHIYDTGKEKSQDHSEQPPDPEPQIENGNIIEAEAEEADSVKDYAKPQTEPTKAMHLRTLDYEN
ncbi:hypothetical protein NQ314_009052 [Rhamnusium bicolor]|uniref:Uncharacterized protein n=1 Tax=Rhamnusium bicolor TaxID=1586634 RepID=A0AAV8Y418_9CUCU|nr:hypothetical protein NQ314_009052 [Rhamnusium bicolor]